MNFSSQILFEEFAKCHRIVNPQGGFQRGVIIPNMCGRGVPTDENVSKTTNWQDIVYWTQLQPLRINVERTIHDRKELTKPSRSWVLIPLDLPTQRKSYAPLLKAWRQQNEFLTCSSTGSVEQIQIHTLIIHKPVISSSMRSDQQLSPVVDNVLDNHQSEAKKKPRRRGKASRRRYNAKQMARRAMKRKMLLDARFKSIGEFRSQHPFCLHCQHHQLPHCQPPWNIHLPPSGNQLSTCKLEIA